MKPQDLVVHVARFGRELRARDLPVTVKDEIDATEALGLIDILDRAEVRLALLSALKIQHADRDIFDEVFERMWTASPNRLWPDERDAQQGKATVSKRVAILASGLPADDGDGEIRDGTAPGYSADALLRSKPFDQWSGDDLAAMERVLTRLARQLATKRSRRLVPVRSSGKADLRRSFRRATMTGGEFLSLARRNYAVEQPQLVLLCDTSGSMDPHTRFLLAFMLTLRRVVSRCEIFAFNTSLTRLTPWLSPGKIGPTLERLVTGVPDWSGGTRIGGSLAEFVTRHQNMLVNSKTVVVIVSDGLDLDEPDVLRRAMTCIRRRAGKVIWLNPLLGDARYEPTARGMAAALPHVDLFAPAHNLRSLERLIPHLAA